MECAHASAIGMVFSANLLVMGWASVYRLLGTEEKDLKKAADALADNKYLQEELGLQALRLTINATGSVRRSLWWVGLISGLASAAYLYSLMLHGSPDLGVCEGWGQALFLAAAYVCPVAMLSMTVIGKGGNKVASMIKEKLEEQAETKRAETQAAEERFEQTIIQRLHLLERQITRNDQTD